jgi:Zn-finger domain-containing protein
MITNIKKLLKLSIRTNNNRLKIALGFPDLNTYLIHRLLKLKDKYEFLKKNLT